MVIAKRSMEAMGIDYQVIFPTPMLQLGLHPNPDMEVALAFAYNRWLTQEVLTGDDGVTTMIYPAVLRRRGLAQNRRGVR